MCGADPDLKLAIDRLYAVFERYPLRLPMRACQCGCMSRFGEEDATLRRTPLRGLARDQLSMFARKAMTTVGDVDDFKHFLPRLFELFSQVRWPANLEIVLGGKLAHAKWTAWPDEEHAAVEDYLHAFWRATLQHYPAIVCADAILACLCRALPDVRLALAVWETLCAEASPARILLGEFICEHIFDLEARRRFSVFVEQEPETPEQVQAWAEQAPGTAGAMMATALQVHEWVLKPEVRALVERAVPEYCTAIGDTTWMYALDRYRAWATVPRTGTMR